MDELGADASALLGIFTNVLDQTFESNILNSPGPVLLAVHARSCTASTEMMRTVTALSWAYIGSIQFRSLAIESAPSVAFRLGVEKAPLLLLFNRGTELDRWGWTGPQSLRGILDSRLDWSCHKAHSSLAALGLSQFTVRWDVPAT